jgi:glycosyltransferase involved in cell wall biosynthesis
VKGWSDPVDRLAVVVPAHDERDLLPRCLAALRAATEPVPTELIVVADACLDDTAYLAAAAGAEVVAITARNVGEARAAGMRHALRHGPQGLWLATTDADSQVPPHWLSWHLTHAEAGADLLLGTVEVDGWEPWPLALRPAYQQLYRAATAAHVHGANLGFSARTYVEVGGFGPLAHDEDRDLIARFRAAGARVVADPDCPVLTSSRPMARAPRGFAAYLSALAAELP